MKGAWLAAVVLAACDQRAQEVQIEADLKQTVQQMMPAVERATGLRFKQRPVVLRRTRAQVRDYVVHKFDDDLPPRELAGAQAAYRLFGLIPDTLDLRRSMIDLLTEQVAGYFDPDSNALYIPADNDPSQARLVVSHELVHALQHQYLNLDSLVQLKRQNDRRSAAQAILEGQATLAQVVVLMPEQKIESLPNLWELRGAVLGAGQEQMKVFASAPLWLRETLIFPYLGGAEFVRWFEHQYPGKQPYGPLMPISTEQILHPARYMAGDRPDGLAFTSSDAVRYEDGLGEFEIRLLFEQFLHDDSIAVSSASGWDGDRYQVRAVAATRRTAKGDALVWYTLWDDAPASVRFAKTLERAWTKRRSAGTAVRRFEVKRLLISGIPAVRLIDAPPGWAGWKRVPTIRVTRAGR
ncbi:MAG TPA: ImmA/IrrE family metallo-endopeptidase [Gemmatimonadales bacterium]|nr:ImmA/IrrE family metallo-endopeptidase [Gemmatimonadales bacterium]